MEGAQVEKCFHFHFSFSPIHSIYLLGAFLTGRLQAVDYINEQGKEMEKRARAKIAEADIR